MRRTFPGALPAMLALLAGCSVMVPAEPPAVGASVELVSVPFFPQARYQCGPAALATALGASGVPVSAASLVDDVYLPDRGGSLQAELRAAARRHGRLPFLVAPEEEALAAELAAGHPVLILQNLGLEGLPRWHYAVVVGYRKEEARWVLRSGRERRRFESVRSFRRHWQGADRWGLVVLAPGELPAQATPGGVAVTLAEAESMLAPAATLASWESALQRWPGNADLAFGAGNAARAAGRDPQALHYFQQALALKPSHRAARNNLADLWLGYDCVERARAVLVPALEGMPRNDALARALAATAREAEAAQPARCRAPPGAGEERP